jgi:PAS domain S-box-containing protein
MGTTSENTIQNRIEDCEKPYHLCAQIQPHGIFCAIDPGSFKIVHVSANAAPFFGREADAMLGSNFAGILTPESADKLSGLAAMDAGTRKSLILTFTDPPGLTADAFLYRSGSLLCIEFELARPDAAAIEVASSRFFELVERIAQTDASSALPGVVCEAIRDLLGVDRVYYIRFDGRGHGHVLGESRNEVLPELIDHRFPATDIPAAARRMFLVNPFRLIPDANASPVAILGGDGTPLDLTMSACRAVAEAHLQYNRNMGVNASCSFPVTRDGHVEALFGGHHATARHLSFRQMMTGRHLVELFQSRFDFLKAREERSLLAERVEALYALSDSFEAAGHDLGAFIAGNHRAFYALMDADGVICRDRAQSHSGSSLAKPDAARLLEFLGSKLATGTDFYQTDCIADDDAQFASLSPAVAGVCAVSLDRAGNNIVAWLRREVVTVQKWGGDPHLAGEIDAEGRVGPRRSFLTYLREVKGTCRPWPSISADLARQLRHAFAQVLASHYERMRAQEELYKSEQELSALVENVPTAIVRYDRQCGPLYLNPAAEQFLGPGTSCPLLGRTPARIMRVDEIVRLAQAIEQVVQTGLPIERCLEYQTSSGQLGYWQTRFVAERDRDGEVASVLTISTDITKLVETERSLRTLVEHAPTLIVRYDRQCRRLYANPAAFQLAGTRAPGLLGGLPRDAQFLPPGEGARLVRAIQQVVETGLPIEMPVESTPLSGQVHYYEARLVPERDRDGEVASVLCIAMEVTKLVETERSLRTLVENLPDAVARFDRQGRFVYWNPLACKTFGHEQNLMGKILPETGPAGLHELDKKLYALVLKASNEGKSNQIDVQWPLPGGDRYFEIRHIPEKDGKGAVTGVLGIARDITERNRTADEIANLRVARARERAGKIKAERQKLETIGRMAGGVAHEINNLLQPIIGMAEIGLDELPADGGGRENFTVILDCARQAASIVRSILTYVRQQTPKAHAIALGKVVEEQAAMIRSMLRPGEYIVLELADTGTLVLGDEGEAGQILLNLVQNACHAMGGKGTVGIALAKDEEGKLRSSSVERDSAANERSSSAERDGAAKEFLRLTVSDTGCGMSAEVAAQAFEPFFSTKPQTEGSGLGLAVVQGIVRDWGGSVSLDTAPGQGTRVHILLPVAAVHGL